MYQQLSLHCTQYSFLKPTLIFFKYGCNDSSQHLDSLTPKSRNCSAHIEYSYMLRIIYHGKPGINSHIPSFQMDVISNAITLASRATPPYATKSIPGCTDSIFVARRGKKADSSFNRAVYKCFSSYAFIFRIKRCFGPFSNS